MKKVQCRRRRIILQTISQNFNAPSATSLHRDGNDRTVPTVGKPTCTEDAPESMAIYVTKARA
jgi:hypothetical protein